MRSFIVSFLLLTGTLQLLTADDQPLAFTQQEQADTVVLFQNWDSLSIRKPSTKGTLNKNELVQELARQNSGKELAVIILDKAADQADGKSSNDQIIGEFKTLGFKRVIIQQAIGRSHPTGLPIVADSSPASSTEDPPPSPVITRSMIDAIINQEIAQTKLTIDDLNATPIIGKLGVPIHTVHKIECEVVDLSFKDAKLDERLAFEIKSVDGELLANRRFVFIPDHFANQELEEGEHYEFWGYETITTEGSPLEVIRLTGNAPSNPKFKAMHFVPKLVVVESTND